MQMPAEEHTADGRRIFISGLQKTSFFKRRIIRNWIITFCRTDEIAASFPTLIFSIEDESGVRQHRGDRSKAWVHLGKGGDYEHTIYLAAAKLPFAYKAGFYGVLRHELTHLLQGRTKEYKRIERKCAALRDRTAENTPSDARQYLAETMKSIFLEGIAVLVQRISLNSISFCEATAKDLRKSAEEHARMIEDGWKALCTRGFENWRDRLEETLYNSRYTLGEHMAYTILCSGIVQNPQEMLFWSDHKFIKLYEKACDVRKEIPLVTLARASPVCYNRMLRELKE